MGILERGLIGNRGRVEGHEIGERAELDDSSIRQAELPRRQSRGLVYGEFQ
jgi:hypothetical protein